MTHHMRNFSDCLAVGLLLCYFFCQAAQGEEQATAPRKPASIQTRIAFVGLHGGIFDVLKRYEKDVNLQIDYLKDEDFSANQMDLAKYRVIFLQHLRREDREHYRRLFTSARKQNPDLRIFSISG